MALLERSKWYDLARSTNWTAGYVTEDQLFPPEMSDPYRIPLERWDAYDEPYKVSYREYVKVQRAKDEGIYSVKTAAARTHFLDDVDPRWHGVLKMHYGGVCLGEACSQIAESRMVRFGKAPGMRNMATFGLLDEIRHAQAQLYFCHENIQRDVQWAWGHKCLNTEEWGAIMARSVFDDTFLGNDAVTTAIELTFAFETGFTNMQFLGLAAEAAEAGDTSFADLISSLQTDEARHAQIGAPALKIMIASGHREAAQRIVDIAFWRTYRFFGLISGCALDYFTPLARRTNSYKEFMLEWIGSQFERSLIDLGLAKPWYWDYFIQDLDTYQHGMQFGLWMWRQTVWFPVPAGVSVEEREWLEQKYPGWNASWGRVWDQVTDNLLAGREELTLANTLPIVCNMCQLPIVVPPGTAWKPEEHTLVRDGRRYYFQSHVDKWVFEQDPRRYGEFKSLVDRAAGGEVQPPTFEGFLNYMGLGPHERGYDANAYAWLESFRRRQRAA